MERNRILVVDDDPLIRGSLYEMLRGRHYDVEMASNGAEAMEHLKRRKFQLVLTDWKMPQIDGMSLLAHIKRAQPEVNVVLITGFGNISSAVEAMREGAFDYLTKPIQPEELEATIQRALSEYIVPGSPEGDGFNDPFAGIVSQDPAMKKLFGMIESIAATPATVLLEGESGTGKRVIAHAIHRADPKRCHHPFVEISCGALPETLLESELFGHVRGSFTGAIRDKQGRFELADGGSVLLDEIDAFTPALQVKLLRVIQDRLYERVGDTRTVRVDVRIIAATNRRLSELVKQGKFREDLYYRLNVICLRLPPLRERKVDLPLLIDHFIARSSQAIGKSISGVTDEAMQLLTAHPWPGNVRELENVIERAVILARHAKIGAEDLSEELGGEGSATAPDEAVPSAAPSAGHASDSAGWALKDALRMPERDLILKVLAEVRWNRSEAAKRLGIHRSTLYHKIKQLGIDTSSK
ncbi:MAG: sigma-54-dependent Fis family transcriptional regulator [Candidatus Omnitrophica bacterium]|nr:sigma-54-dependent Fis family transcriptional regulator [Candidatus Omnitrophota bacterium]